MAGSELASSASRKGHVTMVEDRPHYRTGKLCYIEIPAAEAAAREAGRHG
jgi:hypothetical protein